MINSIPRPFQRSLAKAGAFENRKFDLPNVEERRELAEIDPATLMAAGLDPVCLPSGGGNEATIVHPTTRRLREAEEQTPLRSPQRFFPPLRANKWLHIVGYATAVVPGTATKD